MFDEDVDEVGSDIEAYCPKCRADTTHVVITKYEDEIRRVQCNPCGDIHSYRKPRGEMDEEPPEPLAARRRQLLKKPTWQEFMAGIRPDQARPYGFRETYAESEIVNHPKFGLGFVSEILSDDKLEVTFKDGRRILVHNRKDLPPSPLMPGGRRGRAPAVPIAAPPPGGRRARQKPRAAVKPGQRARPAAKGRPPVERVTRPAPVPQARPKGKPAKVQPRVQAKLPARGATPKGSVRRGSAGRGAKPQSQRAAGRGSAGRGAKPQSQRAAGRGGGSRRAKPQGQRASRRRNEPRKAKKGR